VVARVGLRNAMAGGMALIAIASGLTPTFGAHG
jgi:hypothetical protein